MVRRSRYRRSQPARAPMRSCVVMRRARPPSASARNRSMSISCVGMSRPVKGSSRSSTAGRIARARATRTRWRCPPDSSPMGRLARSRMPTRDKASSTARKCGVRARPSRPRRTVTACRTASRTLIGKSHANSCRCGTYPIAPSVSTLPLEGMSPRIERISVVFPAPLGPMRPTSSPARASRSTPSRTLRPPRRAPSPVTRSWLTAPLPDH